MLRPVGVQWQVEKGIRQTVIMSANQHHKKDHALAVGVVSDFPAIGYLKN